MAVLGIEDVLGLIVEARIQIGHVQRFMEALEGAQHEHQKEQIMSQLSDDIDAVNATLVNLDDQAPAAIKAAIAAAGSGGTSTEDPAARASLTTLQATVAKVVADLQAAVGPAPGA